MNHTLESLQKLAEQTAKEAMEQNFFLLLLEGNLGTGKTTFARAFMETMSITEPVRSPTYTIENRYKILDKTIHHLDLYRLGDYHEFHDQGWEELLHHHQDLWLIEWPELILPHIQDLPYTRIQFSIPENTPDQRSITITKNPTE